MVGAFFFGKSSERDLLGKEMQEKARLEKLADQLASETAMLKQQLSRVELNLQGGFRRTGEYPPGNAGVAKEYLPARRELKLYRELLQDGGDPMAYQLQIFG